MNTTFTNVNFGVTGFKLPAILLLLLLCMHMGPGLDE
jgi:hypothetical protein